MQVVWKERGRGGKVLLYYKKIEKCCIIPSLSHAQIKIMMDVATCMPNHYLRFDWLRIAQIYGVPGFVIAHLFYHR